MSYIFTYFIIGLLLALWDFRKYAKLAFWHIRFWNVKEYMAIIAYGPKPSVDLWSMPGYIRDRNYFIVLIFILIWPIKIIFFNARLNAFVRNVRAGRISIFSKKKEKSSKFILDESLMKLIINWLKNNWIECVGSLILLGNFVVSLEHTTSPIGNFLLFIFTLSLMWGVSYCFFKNKDEAEHDSMPNVERDEMEKSWHSLTPRELKNAKIISIAFLIISISIIFLSKIVGVILLLVWGMIGSGPFILGSKDSIKNKVGVLKMVEPRYGSWKDDEIEEQIKAIEECGYKWFEQKGRVGFKHKERGVYLNIEGLHFYKPEEIKRVYREVWSKNDPSRIIKAGALAQKLTEAISGYATDEEIESIILEEKSQSEMTDTELAKLHADEDFIANFDEADTDAQEKKINDQNKYILESLLSKYENIVNYLSLGCDSNYWNEFILDSRRVVLHDDSIYYDKTLTELGCPNRARHNLYTLKQTFDPNHETLWEVKETHSPFNIRMAGSGTDDIYQESKDGKIVHLEQTGSWVS